MKKDTMISRGTGNGHGFKIALTIISIAGIFMLFFPTATLGQTQSTGSLSPLSEGALKFSPGKFVSEYLKRSKQFIFINELLLIDELILKTKKFSGYDMFMVPSIPKELICRQLAILLKEKEETLNNLDYAISEPHSLGFRKYDLLVELEIVDDLLLVQQAILNYLNQVIAQSSCKSFSKDQVKMLMSEQKKLLMRIKDGLLNSLEAQQQ